MAAEVIDRKLESRAAKLEKKIFGMKQELAAIHRKGKPRAVADYALRKHDGKPFLLSQAFGKHKDLVVVHNMGAG